ncbi:LLM class flavin-dependent oxidoreductase [Mycolicibacterium mengxianglii]|uniref:LLM class flavin-dependent oxidoreductase n=1 Tax=Mycolicibacterium mengxianglii TaxID=2736649 RepID=UPI0018D0FBD4
MKVGVGELPANTRFGPMTFMDAGYRSAAAARVDSFWVPDHLNALLPRSVITSKYTGAVRFIPKIDACLEPWTTLGYLAARHRRGRMLLGTGVTDTGRRNPAVTAQAIATLHLMTRGRAVLGIGTGEREGNEPYGVDWSRPVARFEEALATIRALWNSGGNLVNRDSEFFPLRNAVFELPPYQGRRPPIWIASHGPRMLRATGRYADGWFPGMIFDPAAYAEGLDKVRTAADDAGRDPGEITPAVWLFVTTGATRAEVDDVLESVPAKTFALNAPAREWARLGARHPMGDDFGGAQDLIPQTLDEATVLKYIADIPLALMRGIGLTGTAGDVLEQAAVWRDHGVRHLVVCNVSALQPSLRRGMASLGPFHRILRGIRRL